VWTGCGQRQCAPSSQADNRLPAMRLRSLIHLSLPALSLSSACEQARSALHAAAVGCTHTGRRTDWTGPGAATPVTPQWLEGATPWNTCYEVARSKQGITASLSLTCSNTAIAQLTTGSTDSTNLRVTMQHKSGTALIWRDRPRLHT